jgi:hypothetical protein
MSRTDEAARRGMDTLGACLTDDARKRGQMPDSRRIESEVQRIARKAEHDVKKKGRR